MQGLAEVGCLEFNVPFQHKYSYIRDESKVKETSICIAHFYAKRLKCAQTWITPANYTMPAFTPQPQNITALWLVLILPSHGG